MLKEKPIFNDSVGRNYQPIGIPAVIIGRTSSKKKYMQAIEEKNSSMQYDALVIYTQSEQQQDSPDHGKLELTVIQALRAKQRPTKNQSRHISEVKEDEDIIGWDPLSECPVYRSKSWIGRLIFGI